MDTLERVARAICVRQTYLSPDSPIDITAPDSHKCWEAYKEAAKEAIDAVLHDDVVEDVARAINPGAWSKWVWHINPGRTEVQRRTRLSARAALIAIRKHQAGE